MKKIQGVIGCPVSENLTIRNRLLTLINQPVRVLIPGKEFNGSINQVSSNSFRVNGKTILLNSPFAIDIGFFETESIPDKVLVRIKGIGNISGCFVRVGIDFIEFEQDLPEDIARWVIPLNKFVKAKCIRTPEKVMLNLHLTICLLMTFHVLVVEEGIEGKVTYAEGLSINYTHILLMDDYGTVLNLAHVRPDGTYYFNAPVGTYTLQLRADGERQINQEVIVVASQTEIKDFTISQ